MKINTAVFHRSVYLENSKLENPDTCCPFCGAKNRESISILQKEPEVQLLKCKSCFATSASRVPTESALSDYYSGYYESASSDTAISSEQVTFDKPSRLAKHIAKIFCKYNKSTNPTILDFGGGDGTISYLLAEELFKGGAEEVSITLVDHTTETVAIQNKSILIERANSIHDIKKEFDLVIASAVIEHYPRPKALLHALLERMKKGGVFYARTPFMAPLMKLLKRFGIKMDFTFPGHIHDLGQDFWECFFSKKNSFRIIKSKPSIVETTLRRHLLVTMAAYTFKAPWFLIGKLYKYVGGWEIFVVKNTDFDKGKQP